MAYKRVNWENLPSTKTPVNATNLNKLNDVIDAKANSNDVYTKTETDTKLNKKVNKSDLIDLIYPVGSIYMSVNNVSPATFMGGTWKQIKDRFLLACGSTYKAGATGGEATHSLTKNEIPHLGSGVGYGGKGIAGGTDWKDTWLGSSNDVGQAHNNMPPYLAVYMWKRTA